MVLDVSHVQVIVFGGVTAVIFDGSHLQEVVIGEVTAMVLDDPKLLEIDVGGVTVIVLDVVVLLISLGQHPKQQPSPNMSQEHCLLMRLRKFLKIVKSTYSICRSDKQKILYPDFMIFHYTD